MTELREQHKQNQAKHKCHTLQTNEHKPAAHTSQSSGSNTKRLSASVGGFTLTVCFLLSGTTSCTRKKKLFCLNDEDNVDRKAGVLCSVCWEKADCTYNTMRAKVTLRNFVYEMRKIGRWLTDTQRLM